MAQPTIVPGVYEHYKGKKYYVIGLTKDSEREEVCVVYRPLYETDWPHLWHRPLTMFCEDVVVNGTKRPRFKLISS